MSKYICLERQLRRLYHLDLNSKEVIKTFLLTACIEDVQEVQHGKWIPGREISRDYMGDILTNIQYEDWRCSNCNCVSEDYRKPTWNYCPNCGAKMEKEDNDD